ncbi:hypothetical protein [Kribbella sp. NPDC000426]|uniref:hypothetical protein n=1 Tax=Kribbella sp. NPDC000426 TaxID=3154255 RepID=UPI00331C0EEF
MAFTVDDLQRLSDLTASAWQDGLDRDWSADFPPRAGLELILHGYDVCQGLGVPFAPPADLCARLREHTRDWPMWTSPGWSSLTEDADAWTDLLRASGR